MIKKMFKVENIFLLLSLFFGMILVLVVPPFQSPDEDSHFLKSYLISKMDFFPKEKDGKIGYDIPIELDKYITSKKEYMGNLEKKYTYTEQYFDQLLSTSYSEKHFRDISTSNVPIVAHLVPAIGVFIGNLNTAFNDGENVGPAVLVQFARMSCVIVYSIIGFFAIKITPKFKKTFFTVLMLPSSLFLRSMVSYDSLILVITCLSLAKMLKIYCDNKYIFKKMDILFFIICGFILLNIKTVYSIIFLLMFFIPNKKFGGIKNKIKYFSIMVGAVVIITLISKIPYIHLGNSSSDLINEQFAFIINHPLGYAKILLKNIVSQFNAQAFWMVGTYGLLDTYIPVLLLDIIYLNLFCIILFDIFNEKLELSIKFNITFAILIFISIMAIYTSMYTAWTPFVTGEVGGESISGVQGRYFLPYICMIPLIFCNKLTLKISNKIKKFIKYIENNLNELYVVIPITSIIVTLIIIVERFWI